MITGKELLASLQVLSEEGLSRPVYSYGCQQCVHPVVAIDPEDKVHPEGVSDKLVIMLETED